MLSRFQKKKIEPAAQLEEAAGLKEKPIEKGND